MHHRSILTAIALSGLYCASASAQDYPQIEVTMDWCRSGDVIHVFTHDFKIDGASQSPVGDTGRALVVPKGTSGVLWNLQQDRWRWRCGDSNFVNQSAGAIGSASAGQAGRYCMAAGVGGALVCSAVGYGVGQLLQGLIGNWEAAACAGAKQVRIDHQANGRIVWTCFGNRPLARPKPVERGIMH